MKSAAPLAFARLGQDFHRGRIAPEWSAIRKLLRIAEYSDSSDVHWKIKTTRIVIPKRPISARGICCFHLSGKSRSLAPPPQRTQRRRVPGTPAPLGMTTVGVSQYCAKLNRFCMPAHQTVDANQRISYRNVGRVAEKGVIGVGGPEGSVCYLGAESGSCKLAMGITRADGFFVLLRTSVFGT